MRNRICQGCGGGIPCRTSKHLRCLAKCALRDSLSIIYRLETKFKRAYDREESKRVCNVMSINALNEKIEKQLEKLNQLKAQKQAIEAREKKKISEQQRKEETRKKILIGSMMLKKMEDEAEKIKILAELNKYLTEDRDRKLFNMLPVKDENETNNLTSNL
jgi:vacuolar-type H+-ATPase subunit I/STV1